LITIDVSQTTRFLSFPNTTFQVSTVSAASALTAQRTHTAIKDQSRRGTADMHVFM